jgi:hypothetical protein
MGVRTDRPRGAAIGAQLWATVVEISDRTTEMYALEKKLFLIAAELHELRVVARSCTLSSANAASSGP